MAKENRQFDFFENKNIDYSFRQALEDVNIDKKVIEEWQRKIINYQSKVFKNGCQISNQYSLFDSYSEELLDKFNPLDLSPLALSFWRWPKPKHEGPAIYFVIDNAINLEGNIILYIGETLSAEKRWKGDHDCKTYLSNYIETLQKASLISNLSIRFWLDVPMKTRERRNLEQNLIKTWLPPFNKETRECWSTPFTTQMN